MLAMNGNSHHGGTVSAIEQRMENSALAGHVNSYVDQSQYQMHHNEDINDRLIESPKTRSYVPLLSKKLKSKNAHGSSENVLQTANSAAVNQRHSS